MTTLTNYTFQEITVGQTATYQREVTDRDILLFAAISGDVNPLHLDDDFAANTRFGRRIAHGMITGALVSAALALELPGPGTVYLSQDLRFRLPVHPGDSISVELTVTEKQERRGLVRLDCNVVNQDGKRVATGAAEVIAPTEKLTVSAPELPPIELGVG
jgi:acyl dehydratase